MARRGRRSSRRDDYSITPGGAFDQPFRLRPWSWPVVRRRDLPLPDLREFEPGRTKVARRKDGRRALVYLKTQFPVGKAVIGGWYFRSPLQVVVCVRRSVRRRVLHALGVIGRGRRVGAGARTELSNIRC